MDLMQKHVPAGEIKTLDELKKLDNVKIQKYILNINGKIRKNIPQKDWPSATILDSKRSVFDSIFH